MTFTLRGVRQTVTIIKQPKGTTRVLTGGQGPAGVPGANVLTTRGDIIVRGPTQAQRLALGAMGFVLGSDGTDVVYLPTRKRLTSNLTLYVRTDGSDSNTGLANSAGGAFLTLQKAINVVTDTLDLAGFTVTVQVGAGTYAAGILMTRPALGGTLKVTGDTTTPANVVLSMAGTCISVSGAGVKLSIEGMKVVASGGIGIGIEAINTGQLFVTGKMDFGVCSLAHIHASYTGFVDVSGVAYNITGAAIYHYFTETFGASIPSNWLCHGHDHRIAGIYDFCSVCDWIRHCQREHNLLRCRHRQALQR